MNFLFLNKKRKTEKMRLRTFYFFLHIILISRGWLYKNHFSFFRQVCLTNSPSFPPFLFNFLLLSNNYYAKQSLYTYTHKRKTTTKKGALYINSIHPSLLSTFLFFIIKKSFYFHYSSHRSFSSLFHFQINQNISQKRRR